MGRFAVCRAYQYLAPLCLCQEVGLALILSEIEKVSDENVKRIKAKFQKKMNDLAVQLTPDNPNSSVPSDSEDTVPTQTQNETNPKAKKYKLSESTTESIEDQRLKLARVSKVIDY